MNPLAILQLWAHHHFLHAPEQTQPKAIFTGQTQIQSVTI